MSHIHTKTNTPAAGFIPQYQTLAACFKNVAKKNPARLARRGQVGGIRRFRYCRKSSFARSHSAANRHQQAIKTHASNTSMITLEKVMTGHPASWSG